MMRMARVTALGTVLFIFASSLGTAGEMKMEMKIDATNPRAVKDRFSYYGYNPPKSIILETDGLRFLLPGGKAEKDQPAQTGVYSYFRLAGDCEVILTYQLLPNMELPTKGYGSGVGLALDVDGGVGKKWRADIQRVNRVGGKSGYAMHSDDVAKQKAGIKPPPDPYTPTSAEWGRMGLRRIKKEIYFLAGEQNDELKEIEHLPFTDETIQVVRLFADPGGSPTWVDARVLRVEIRAEEITGGVAERDVPISPLWWLLLVIPVAGMGTGLTLMFWRFRRRRVEED
jgi:hypothetical protein